MVMLMTAAAACGEKGKTIVPLADDLSPNGVVTFVDAADVAPSVAVFDSAIQGFIAGLG
jgi:predicted small lipoprotein YifL